MYLAAAPQPDAAHALPMDKKPGQRIAIYEIVGAPDDAPQQLAVGKRLADRPRGRTTWWEFVIDGQFMTIQGKRLGFARVNDDGNSHTPEPELQAVFDQMKAAA